MFSRAARWGISIFGALVLAAVAGIVSATMAGPSSASFVQGQTAQSSAASPAAAAVSASELAQREASLTAALSAMAAQPGAPQFAVEVEDHITGETFAYGIDESFQTASVVKVEILAETLLQAKQSGQPLTADQQALADKMIRQSDNAAASTLWKQIGDTAGLSAANMALGLNATVPGTDGYWGLTTTTVSDQVRLLDAIANPSGPLGDDNQVLLNLMGSVEADQQWGVSAAANSGETVQLKNGWMQPVSDTDTNTNTNPWTVNSVGRITGPDTDVTIAILSHGHTTLDGGITFVQNIATLTRAQLGW